MAGIDINRTSAGAGVLLPPQVSQEIWAQVQLASIIQTLARKIPLPGAGVVVPIITGDPNADWVAETAEKPVSRPTFGSKNIKGYTLAVIEPFSNQFRRDLTLLYDALVARLPLILAKKFDQTCLGFSASPGTGFDTLAGAPTVAMNPTSPATAYDAFLAALGAVTTVDYAVDLTAWALSTQGEITALGAKDTMGHPLFLNNITTEGSIGNILARPVYKAPAAFKAGTAGTPGVTSTLGFGGDWKSAVWGYVEGIRVDVSDQATLNDGGTPLNLWQRNMFAVRCEVEIGFAVRDINRFVRLTGPVPAA